jgi:hypothetical protein
MAEDVVKFVGVKDALKTLRTVEPEIYKQLRKDIRQISSPAVVNIRTTAPTVAPLSGMNNNGRTGYSGVAVSIAITPGQRSRALGSTTANLVAIKATGRNKQAGFNIADMAGRGSAGRTPSGQAMIRNLQGRASRFVYPAIESKLPAIRAAVADSIEKATLTINRKLNRL